MRRIAVLTSGDDGPGFNPCIRAVVRMGIHLGLEVYGVREGYAGLIDGRMQLLEARDVGGIIGRGGTMLGATRCPEFETEEGRRRALDQLSAHGIEGLVVIGGDGSLRGALALHEMGFPVVGIPGSINNDIAGTDTCIGVDTALNTALIAIDKIKDTASSHQRAFLIEVMGRENGYLALMAGMAGGAEAILVPEVQTTPEDVAQKLLDAYVRGKAHAIVVVAEGYRPGTAAVAQYLRDRQEELGFHVRMTVLGHIQRGGSPTAFDRLLATWLGAAAVRALKEGQRGIMVGFVANKVTTVPLEEALVGPKPIDPEMYELAAVLDK